MSLGQITEVAPFDHQHPYPGDLRLQRVATADRDAISQYIRWEGMTVYCTATQTTYQLVGGILNTNWVIDPTLNSHSAAVPLVYNPVTGAFSINLASGTQPGYLATADWLTFNGKQAPLSGSGLVKSTAGTISYVSGTAGQFVKGDGSLDGSAYLTANQAIILTATGDATGVSSSSGTAPAITLTIASTTITSKLLTGLSIAGSNILPSDTILSALGKLQNMITGLAGSIVYQGVWNASTNTSPTLTSGTGTKGWLYKISVAGTTTLDGVSQWNVGDQVVFDGTTWDKIDGVASEVLNFNGRVGAISLLAADVNTALGYTAYNGSTNPSGFLTTTTLTASVINTGLGYTAYNGSTNLSGFLTGTTGIQNGTALQASSNFNISGIGTASSFSIPVSTNGGNNFLASGSGGFNGYSIALGNGYVTGALILGITVSVPNITTLNTQPLFQNTIAVTGTSADISGQDLYSFNGYIVGAPSTAVLNRNLLSIRNNGTSMLTVSPVGTTTIGGSLVMTNTKNGGIYWNSTPAYVAVVTGYSFGMEQNLSTGVFGAFTSGASNTAGSTTLKTYLYGFDANSNLTFTSNVPVITVTNNMAVQGYFTGALKTNGSLQAGLNSATTTAGNHILSSASVSGTPSSKYQILNIGTTNQISFFAETNGSSSIGFNTNTNAGNTTNTANEAGFAATMNFNQSTGAFSFLNTATTVALNGILPFAYALTIDKSGNGILSGQLSAQNINLSVGGVAAQAPYGIINVSVPNNATSYTAFSILQPGNIGWGIGISSGLLFIGQGGSAATNGANTTMQQLFTFNNLGNFTANGSGTFAGTVASKGFKAAINGVNSDPYAPISVTNIADASNHSYYSLTKSGVVAWNIGITGSGNSLFFGSGGSLTANGDNIASSTVFIVDTSGNGTLAGAITSKGTNKQIVTISAAYTVLVTDEVIQCQGTTGAYTVTLPAAGSSFLGKVITIIRDPNSSGATITVTVASAAAIQSPTGGYGATVPLGLSGAAGSRLSYINNGGGGWVLLSSF